MGILFAAVLHLVAAGGPAHGVPPDPRADRPAAGDAGASLACPEGTVRHVEAAGEARLEGCQDAEGQYHGPLITRDASGRILRRLTFRHGTLDGPARFYAPSGRLVEEGRFEAGVQSGLWRAWREDGSRRYEGAYRAGLREGRWRWWDAKGTLRRETYYDGGRRSGPHRLWWQNGRARLRMQLLGGQPEGRLEARFPDASLALEAHFEGGRIRRQEAGPPPPDAVSPERLAATYRPLLERAAQDLPACLGTPLEPGNGTRRALEAHLHIEPTGSVAWLELSGGAALPPATRACIRHRLEELELPLNGARDLVEVVVPLRF
ncbi:MAG: hypothetical protein D6729_19500 [Deltaproteobacteria bacterium]|nr:MAG: hypothetical protein D6729_19500 [Deltaproteobacteria bacterium]